MSVNALTLRVAARFRREVIAAFLSAKWFKVKTDAMKAILKKPLGRNPEYWSADIMDVEVFFEDFQREFHEIVANDQARDSIKNRVTMAKDYVGAVKSKLPDYESVDFKSPAGFLAWNARSTILEKMKESAKTIGDLFKYQWVIDKAVIDRLVQKTLKAATPEELDSLTSESSWTYQIKFSFLDRIGFEKSALRALSKTKLDWDPSKWVDRMFEMLQANYSDEAIQRASAFREFDLHGMKVVVDDRTVDAGDIKKYVRYLDEAFEKMKAKGFAKAWYGTVFIQCEGCGGVNPNTGGGVGGHYKINKDTVSIFSRPGWFIVELMTHELGHRYWFKQMSATQRGKFESLVRVQKGREPSNIIPNIIPEEKVKAAKARVDEEAQKVRAAVIEFKSAGMRAKYWFKAIEKHYQPMFKSGWAFSQNLYDAIHSAGASATINPEVKSLFDDAVEQAAVLQKKLYDADEELKRKVHATPETEGPIESVDRFWAAAFKAVLLPWYEDVTQKIEAAIASAYIYIDASVQAFNEEEKARPEKMKKDWTEAWENDPRQVFPVSNYGKSNIDEAFAEVFSHYCLGEDMTRDQLESFRAVVSSEIARSVAARFITHG